MRLRSLRSAASLLALSLAALALSGCTTYVQVASDPEGAVISSADGRETYGRAPVEVPYKKSELEAAGGVIPGFTATWPSGAKASTEMPYVVKDFRFGAQIELKRPEGAPGLDQDLRFALERAQARAKAAEAERERMRLYMNDGWFWGPRWGMGWGWWW